MPRPIPAEARAVSPLELFFDLVYVFAISQLSHHLLSELSWRGAIETLVMLCAVFTIWVHTAFEATFLDITRRGTQILVLAGMAAGLFMNAGISSAWGAFPWLFVVPLVLIQLGRPLGTAVLADIPALRRHFRAMFVWLAASTPLWLIGAAADAEHRLWWWLGAAAIDLAGTVTAHPLPGKPQDASGIPFDGPHLQERLQLFLIIALGEVVLTTGTAIAEAEPRPATLLAGVLGFVAVAALWATYFAGAADVVEDMVEHNPAPVDAARIAASVQYLVSAGLVVVAVGAELAVAEPDEHGSLTLGLLLFGGALLYIGAQQLFLRLATPERSRARLVAAAALVIGIAVASAVPALVSLALLDVILVALAAVLTRQRQARRRAAEPLG